MNKNFLQPIATIFLGISIMVGSYWISQAIINKNMLLSLTNPIEVSALQQDTSQLVTMTLSEASAFLGVTEYYLQTIMENSKLVDGNGIPYFKISNEVRFNKEELINWVKYSAQNHLEY